MAISSDRPVSASPQDISIAEAAARYRVTPRAVRFYEGLGLFRCLRDDRRMRLLDAEAERRLGQVVQLRDAGVSLSDMPPILNGQDSFGAVVREKLRDRLHELDLERARLAALLQEGKPSDAGPGA